MARTQGHGGRPVDHRYHEGYGSGTCVGGTTGVQPHVHEHFQRFFEDRFVNGTTPFPRHATSHFPHATIQPIEVPQISDPQASTPDIPTSSTPDIRPCLPWLPDNTGFSLVAGNQIATSICESFKKKQDPNGWTWRRISREIVEIYWEDFQKHWSWDATITNLVRSAWEKKAKILYTDLLMTLRTNRECNNNYKPDWIERDTWKAWIDGWKSPANVIHRKRTFSNRRREVVNKRPDSTHTGGLISDTKRLRLHQEETRETPSSYELFARTHQIETADGKKIWINLKAQAISEEYHRLLADKTGPISIDELNAMYLASVRKYEEAPKNNKEMQEVFDIGSMTHHNSANIVTPFPSISRRKNKKNVYHGHQISLSPPFLSKIKEMGHKRGRDERLVERRYHEGRDTGTDRASTSATVATRVQPHVKEHLQQNFEDQYASTPSPSPLHGTMPSPRHAISFQCRSSNLSHASILATEVPYISGPHIPNGSTKIRPRLPWLADNSGFASDVGSQVATSIRRSFEKKQDPNGWTWKLISKEIVEFYWHDFQEHWSWDVAITSLVRSAWEKKAKVRYSNFLFTHRANWEHNNNYKPYWIEGDTWKSWIIGWNSVENVVRRAQNFANRRRGDVTRGADATYTGGSVSHARTLRLLHEQTGETPSSYELFARTHQIQTKDGKKLWINQKAQAISEEYHRLLAEKTGPTSVDEMNAMYLEAVKKYEDDVPTKKKKKEIFGIGSATHHYFADIVTLFPSATAIPSHTLLEERFSRLNERWKRFESKFGDTLSHGEIHQSQLEEQKEGLRQVREEMQHFMRFMTSMFSHPSSPPPPSPGAEEEEEDYS